MINFFEEEGARRNLKKSGLTLSLKIYRNRIDIELLINLA